MKKLAFLMIFITASLCVTAQVQNSVALESIISPTNNKFVEGRDIVTVTIRNMGTSDLNSFVMEYRVLYQNPVGIRLARDIVYILGGLPCGSSDTFTFMSDFVVPFGEYEFCAWVSTPNGVEDSITDDDTLCANIMPPTKIMATICEGENYLFGGDTLTQAGVYWDTLQNSLNEDSIIVLTLRVNPLPEIPIITKNGNELTSSFADNYQWYFNNTPITGATGQSYVCTQNGMYFVEVTNEYACTAKSDDINIGDVKIIETTMNDFRIYPNPTTGQLTINNEQLIIENVELFDIMGKKAPLSPPEGGKSPLSFGEGSGVRLDISHLANGIYMLKINNSIVKKIIKH